MKAVLGLTGIAAVRGPLGLVSQGLAGAFAGWIFFRIKLGALSPQGTITPNKRGAFIAALNETCLVAIDPVRPRRSARRGS